MFGSGYMGKTCTPSHSDTLKVSRGLDVWTWCRFDVRRKGEREMRSDSIEVVCLTSELKLKLEFGLNLFLQTSLFLSFLPFILQSLGSFFTFLGPPAPPYPTLSFGPPFPFSSFRTCNIS